MTTPILDTIAEPADLRTLGRDQLAPLAQELRAYALEAAGAHDATVANMRFVKPLDAPLVMALAEAHDALVTVEENVVGGGAGSGVGELLAASGVQIPLRMLGLPDTFIDHGDAAFLRARCGLDAKGMTASISRRFGTLAAQWTGRPAAA